jgi:outer membrane protein assembly factor BamB
MVKWIFTTGGDICSAAAIGNDGTIYFGSSDYKLYAIYSNGSKKWDFETGYYIEHTSPTIGPDGTIYVGSDDNNLYAINPNGTEKWRFATKGNIYSSPAISSDGTIYVGSMDYKLYAIDPDGNEKWNFTTGDSIASSPAIASDGTIYVGSYDDRLYAISVDGIEKWSFKTGSAVFSSPAIGSDGIIYFGSWDNNVYAVYQNGTKKWNFKTYDLAHSSPAIGSDGTIYVGSHDHLLYAINPDGTKKWHFVTGGFVRSSPAIDSDGTIYVGSYDDKLYAIGSPDLYVNVTSHFSELNSAAQSSITIHVTDGTNPVQGATVNLVSDNGGIFSPQSGITDANGDFKSIFNAPTVTTEIICRISAEASETGFNNGSGYVDVAINPIPWPMFRQNLNHTGFSPYDASSNPGKLKWSFTTGNGIMYSSPAIGINGTIFISSLDNKLYAINPDGTQKWNFTMTGPGKSSPAIGSDGTIYVGSNNLKLWAVNSDGTEKWNFTTGWSVFSSPVIGSDGTIYVGSSDYKFYAINPDGTEKWSYMTGGRIWSSPAIGYDGTIYVGSHDNNLYAFNPDGTKKWSFMTGLWVDTSPLIGPDGTIYVGSRDDNIYAINPDGTKKWSLMIGWHPGSSPAIDVDGTIYIGSWDGKLHAINPNGTEKWNFTTNEYIEGSSPAIGYDGTIYFGSDDNKLYAVNPDGSEIWNFTTDGGVRSSPAIGIDGTIYVGSTDHKLYAIGEGGTPPIANAGPDQTIYEGDTAHFDASSSYDPDGIIETYEWDFDSNDGLWWETDAVPDATSPTPTHIYGDDGIYIVTLRVTDNDNLSSTDTCNITVQNVNPTVETGIGEGVTREWITTYDSPRMDWGKDIAVDSLGYIYVTGARSVDEDEKGYDNYLTLKYDPDGNKLWEGEYNGPANTEDRPEALALDSSGNVFVTGRSYGVGTANDWATVKYNTSGNELWVARHTSPGEYGDKALAIAVDASGNAYVTGNTARGGLYSDITTIAYDPDGNELWIGNYDGFGNSDYAFDIALDSLGNIYVTGSSRSIGNTDEHYNYTTIKYDNAGNELWVASYDGPANDTDRAWALAVDLQGNVYVTGQSVGNSSYREFATVKYDTNGSFQWVARYKGSGNNHDWPVDIETDTQGFVYVTGKSYGNGTRTDIATIKYDSLGNELWAVRYDDPWNKWDEPYEIAVDSKGNIYIAAEGGSNGTHDDALILAYDTNGNEIWMDRYNGPMDGWDQADAIAVDSQYNVYVTGFQYGIDTVGDIITIKYSPPTLYEYYEGSPITFSANATDPGSDDLTFTWNWGDGTPDIVTTYYNDGTSPEPVYDPTTNEVKSPWGTYPFSVTDTVIHTYGDDGIYNVTTTIEDDDGGVSTYTMKVTVQNVNPTVTIDSVTMEVEIGLRVAGRKYNNVSMTLYEDDSSIGYVSIERLHGSPNEQIAWIPVSINFSKSYSATVFYTPEDPPNVGGNPVWIYIKSKNGNINRIHHTFNVQQSKKRDSEHWNHVEPWKVNLNGHFIGLPFEIISHITDPGSDDEILTFTYGSQVKTVTYLNNPPNPDSYPSPEVNPVDIMVTTTLIYEGPGTVTLVVKDDDNIRLGVEEGTDLKSVG